MATKNVKKILLNKDGNNFVVDIENVVRSVNGVKADENGNVTVNADNANHANQADELSKSVNISLSGAVQGSASLFKARPAVPAAISL